MDALNDYSRSIDVHEEMHSLFVLALLSAHPDPETVRGQFRTLLNGLAAVHSRYVFGDDFVVSVRRSILRFDRMLHLVLAARSADEPTATVASAVPAVAESPIAADSPSTVEPIPDSGSTATLATLESPVEITATTATDSSAEERLDGSEQSTSNVRRQRHTRTRRRRPSPNDA
jgi:hypothetical protein